MVVAVPDRSLVGTAAFTGKIPVALGDLTLRPRIFMLFLYSPLQIQEY